MHQLEKLLNLPESQKIIQDQLETIPVIEDPAPDFLRSIDELDRISSSLPTVKGLGDASDREFDDLARRATDTFETLVDLGLNVEAKYSSRIFEVASSMLKNAIDAKSAKIDKKLRIIELQIKKQKLDLNTKSSSDPNAIQGDGFIVSDRNSLLARLQSISQQE